MATIPVRDSSNQSVGEVSVTDAVFDRAVRKSLLHEAVVEYQAGQRQGTHATKTRAEVRGGGRKPWRQKGTGRARHGSIRSPIWRKGGIVFGPKPRDHSFSIGRKKGKHALQMALTVKAREGKIVVVDSLELDAPRTREMAALLEALEIDDGRVLIYDPDDDETLALASRNIPGVEVVTGYGLSVYELLRHDWLLTSEAGIERIDEALR